MYSILLAVAALHALQVTAAYRDELQQRREAVQAEISVLEQCLTNPPVTRAKTFVDAGVKYTLLGRDDSGLFCTLSTGRTALVPWNKLPSLILAQYKSILAQERLRALRDKERALAAMYKDAVQRAEQGYVYSDGLWILSNQAATVTMEPTNGTAALKEEWGDEVTSFSVFTVRFGMTPLEVLDVWPDAKRALTGDGYFTLELDRPAENLHLTAFFDDSRRVIMIMVLFENLTTTKRDSIIEALDEKYTRESTRRDEKDAHSVDYTYKPGEKIILVVKSRRFPMGHLVACTYGHIDKYRKHEQRQKEKMKEALKTVL